MIEIREEKELGAYAWLLLLLFKKTDSARLLDEKIGHLSFVIGHWGLIVGMFFLQ
ncbi:hypothetical protein Ple7327_3296 [Pleurocapsa sp. PCC 7327]|nr:hypothetical protein Ple7327_3296 [Pleurocapsa sp. PCC 7327]